MKKLIIILVLLFAVQGLFAVEVSPEKQYIAQAEQVFAQGNYKYAIDLYNSALKINQQSAVSYLGIGACKEMQMDLKAAEIYYNKAKVLDPEAVVPNLEKIKALEKNSRGKNIDKIREKYHALFDKQKPEVADASLGLALPGAVTPTAVESAPVAAEAAPADSKNEKEWWHRGGAGKMLSLGGISFIYPDRTTALDGAGFGIDAGLLFRKQSHVFNISPKYGYTRDLIKSNDPLVPDIQYDSMFATINDSGGDISWPSDLFFNAFMPYYFNSYLEDHTSATEVNKNSGNLFGAKYTAGVKILPVFGIAGSVGFQYVPYTNIREDASGNTRTDMSAMALFWQGGVGLKLPGLFMANDGLDFTACWGTYHTAPNYFDLKSSYWLDLPYSLADTSIFNKVSKTPLIVLGENLGNFESTETLSTVGYVYKGGVHYNVGNEQQEAFLFVEAPYAVEYKTQLTTGFKYTDEPIAVSETKSEMLTIGTGRKFYMETGVRSNLKYVITGFKYAYDYSEKYMTAGSSILSGVVLGKQIDKNHIFTTGVNIVPLDFFSIPFEINYGLYSSENEAALKYLADWNIRGGVEIKPLPIVALRGGLSYETLNYTYKRTAELTPSPAVIVGYHAGVGLDLPIVEINLGGAYKEKTETPIPAGQKSRSNYYMLWTADLNVYL